MQINNLPMNGFNTIDSRSSSRQTPILMYASTDRSSRQMPMVAVDSGLRSNPSFSSPLTDSENFDMSTLALEPRSKGNVQVLSLMKKQTPEHLEWKTLDYWTFILAISHIIMLIVLTTFISIMFLNLKDNPKIQENHIQLVSSNWIVTPGNCKMWVDGNCVRSEDVVLDPKSLEGVLHETEKSSNGLFSSVNAPFLSLAALVLSTSFSFSMLKTQDDNITPKMFRSFALLILVVYGVLFLFIQQDWHLPMNNLFLVEATFMISFVLINTFAVEKKHMYWGLKLLNAVFTYPLIAISIFSIIGEDNTNNLIIIYFSLTVALLIIVIVNNEASIQTQDFQLQSYFLVSFWLSLLPFLFFCGLRFEYMTYESPIEYPLWSVVAIILLFTFYVLDGIIWTLQYTTDWLNITATKSNLFLKTFELVEKYILVLLVVIGFYNEFK